MDDVRCLMGENLTFPSQNLDIQYTVGVATGVPNTFISVGDNNRDGINGFLYIINSLLAESNPPQVLTTSYGFNEPEIPSGIAKWVPQAAFTKRHR